MIPGRPSVMLPATCNLLIWSILAADGILRHRRGLQGLIDVERRRARNRWI
jgi:hypothetical protein